MTMKKNIFLSLFVSNLLFAQNSILSDANGTQALQKIIGIGSSTIYNGVFTTKSSQYITSGTVSSDIAVAAVNVVATNSTHRNTAIMGIAGGNGGSGNYGVIGFTNSVGSGESYGGFFNVGGGSTGTKYGISASITNIVPSTYAGVAGHFTNIGNSSVNNMGISSSVDNQGQGDAIAGYFKSFNALNNSGFRYGIISEATGPGVNYGLKTVAAGGNKNIGGYFLSHSDPLNNSYQLVLEETAADFVRISFGNSNGQGWHQAVFRGTTASNSLFNFYYAPNGIDILSLIGDGNATLAGLLTQSSDIRLKKNIQKMRDDAAGLEEVVRLADGERGRALQFLQPLALPLPLRRAEEKNVAALQLLRAGARDGERAALDRDPFERLLQFAAERVRADYADDDGRAGRGERALRPLDETREVDQPRGLHLIFGGRGRLGARWQRESDQPPRQQPAENRAPARAE